MDTERAEQNAEHACKCLGLISDLAVILCSGVLPEGIRLHKAAVRAHSLHIRIGGAESLCALLILLLEIRVRLTERLLCLLEWLLRLLKWLLRLLELNIRLLTECLLERLRCLLKSLLELLTAAHAHCIHRVAADLADHGACRSFGTALCAIFDARTRGKTAIRTCNIGVKHDFRTISAKHMFVTSFGSEMAYIYISLIVLYSFFHLLSSESA